MTGLGPRLLIDQLMRRAAESRPRSYKEISAIAWLHLT
jgi:hypothetical protein